MREKSKKREKFLSLFEYQIKFLKILKLLTGRKIATADKCSGLPTATLSSMSKGSCAGAAITEKGNSELRRWAVCL